MLEGNEVEKQVGAGGKLVVDVSSQGIAKVEFAYAEGVVKGGLFVEVDVLDIVSKLVADSANKVDDALLGMLRAALGR
jgi:hypothetical protein